MVDLGDALADAAGRLLAFLARLGEAAGQLLEIVGESADLRGGLVRGGGDLVGEAREPLMQALDRVTRAVVRAGALDALKPVGQRRHAAAEMVEGDRLLARRDIDLGRGLAHGAVVFGLIALGGFETPRHAAQLFLDAAVDVAAFALAARDAGQHVLGVAALGGGARFRRGGIGAAVGGPLLAGRGHVVRRVGEAAQYAPGHPFADRQAFPARRRSCGFAGLGRDARHVPGYVRPHFDSLSTAPTMISTGVKM